VRRRPLVNAKPFAIAVDVRASDTPPVSEENIDVVRRWVELFNTRDIAAMLRLSDPSIEFHSVFAAVGGAIYRGHDQMRRWHRDLQETWGEEIRLEPEAYFDLGEDTLTFYMYYARGQHSGAEVAMPAASVVRVRDGLITYVKAYSQRAEALSDLGLTEDELDPVAP
jgi:ketosteroid isomerase-like protein